MCNCSFDESDKIEIVFFTRIFGFLFVESHHMLKRSCLDIFIVLMSINSIIAALLSTLMVKSFWIMDLE